MTAFARSALFVSSYAPLFAVFALLDSFGHSWVTGICAVLALGGPSILAVLLRVARKLAPQPLSVQSAQVRDGDALAYIATYLVPFAAMELKTGREQLALALFVLLLAVVYVRSELLYINPLLAVLGYRIYQVASPAGASVVLITPRRFLASGEAVSARRLGDYIYWEAKP